MFTEKVAPTNRWALGNMFHRRRRSHNDSDVEQSRDTKTPKWSMGVLNDKQTVEVPGSVLLLAAHRNEPLGLRNIHARTSHSSIPVGFPVEESTTPGGTHHSAPRLSSQVEYHRQEEPAPEDDIKKTEDGAIILDPQPEDSANDPLNWPSWRRDCALLSLGFYCMLGGGMTPIIAAGFTDVAQQYGVEVERVSLTTGLYMLGLGLGSVIASPTAILYGKRPVYIVSAILFIGTSLWAGFSPTFSSLLAARVFQGVAISPVECLPSATIAEIFFLHERAFRIGIYTLLLLGGKNIVPLVSAAIIGRFGWRWTFYIVAIIVALAAVFLFLFVPETFWDRTPTKKASTRPSFFRRMSSRYGVPRESMARHSHDISSPGPRSPGTWDQDHAHQIVHIPHSNVTTVDPAPPTPRSTRHSRNHHVGFVDASDLEKQPVAHKQQGTTASGLATHEHSGLHASSVLSPSNQEALSTEQAGNSPSALNRVHSPTSRDLQAASPRDIAGSTTSETLAKANINASSFSTPPKFKAYTHNLRQKPALSFTQQLKLYHGRLNNDKWIKVMVRPFVLFAYPAVLWSAVVYACSIGWLIVISETMAIIYRDPDTYNFTALQTGLVYLSPFIGGILGTGVAGKVSDVIVKVMARRNGGLYEPEFRLIMAIPILITVCVGLMGFGWSAQLKDSWIVPTLFFGIMSFGCSLGSTTSITFCVDSYRQYAGEALVTLNFTKNVIHGFVFSLFVTDWLKSDGSKTVYIWLGVIHLLVMLFTIPLFIYGKRLRMWTVRMNFMEKF